MGPPPSLVLFLFLCFSLPPTLQVASAFRMHARASTSPVEFEFLFGRAMPSLAQRSVACFQNRAR